MQNCIDAVSNALARSKVGCPTAVSSPLPFAHVQLTRGEYEGDHHKFKLVAEKYGEGQVNRKNLADVWKRELKAREVRRRNDVATMPQRCRNDVAHKSARAPPLQGKRPVSAPLQAGTMGRKSPEESTASSALSTSSKKPPPVYCQEARLPQAQPMGDGLPQPGRQGEG